MSGGHWNHAGRQIKDTLEWMARDAKVKSLWPITGRTFAALGDILYKLEHDIDWALSGDTDPDKLDDKVMAGQMFDAVLREMPDEWFPRGKWATIQALQERSGS